MGFWIFMFGMVLLIPVSMAGFGRLFLKKIPKVNGVYGYRTAQSMKNTETWKFAHQYCGRLWKLAGMAMLPSSGGLMVLAIGKDIDFIGMWGALLCLIQCIVMIGTIILTEMALKRNFDPNGRRRK